MCKLGQSRGVITAAMPILLIRIVRVITRDTENHNFFADMITVLQLDALCLTGTKHILSISTTKLRVRRV